MLNFCLLFIMYKVASSTQVSSLKLSVLFNFLCIITPRSFSKSTLSRRGRPWVVIFLKRHVINNMSSIMNNGWIEFESFNTFNTSYYKWFPDSISTWTIFRHPGFSYKMYLTPPDSISTWTLFRHGLYFDTDPISTKLDFKIKSKRTHIYIYINQS